MRPEENMVNSNLIGVWRLLAFDTERQHDGARRPSMGPCPRGRLVLLPSGIMVALVTAGDRPVPKTEAERAHALNTMLSYSGPYEVVGNEFRTHVDISWNEAWMHTVQTRYFTLDGDHLSIMSDWAPSPVKPDLIVRGLLEWERESS